MPDTKIIKQSLQWRAKYKSKRQPSKQTLRCGQMEAIRSLRTKSLVAEILEFGYDPVEATVNSVAVEIDVDPSGCPSSKFSEHFNANTGSDPDHYSNPEDNILFASLSHNHRNVAERNMANGMPGCACEEPAISRKDCCCNVKPILDDTCNYSLAKLKKADKDWYNDIVGGLEWEILSQDMDKEEPTAAHRRVFQIGER